MKRHEKQVDKNDVLSRKPTREELDLGGLGMQVGSMTFEDLCRGAKERVAKIEAERDEFIAKYGRKEGLRRWLEYTNPTPDHDTDLKLINQGIYNGSPLFVSGTGSHANMFSDRGTTGMARGLVTQFVLPRVPRRSLP